MMNYILLFVHILILEEIVMEVEEKIKNALSNVKAWQRVPTSLDGIFLVKTPVKGGKETMLVEINPKDEKGNFIKRRGLFLKSINELDKFKQALDENKLEEVIKAIENITGAKEMKKIETVDL